MEKEALINDKIANLEKEIMENQKSLVKLKRQIPLQKIEDYAFKDINGTVVKLSELFGDKEDLIVIHNMGSSCPYCTMWADGFNGVLKHLENRASFVIVSPDSTNVQKAFSKKREWKIRIYSAKDSMFIQDMGFVDKGAYLPGVSTFYKSKDGKIFRVAKSIFGPGDPFCAVWHFFDLLYKGANEWEPGFEYTERRK